MPFSFLSDSSHSHSHIPVCVHCLKATPNYTNYNYLLLHRAYTHSKRAESQFHKGTAANENLFFDLQFNDDNGQGHGDDDDDDSNEENVKMCAQTVRNEN